ncbi:4-diphosphocytidyl-2-C-methyl-D-erythritol kinase [Nitrosomonas nitrosa]|jgi:4-diphosphocytidyl-2-C-methyl-D-erythritol kinase|uniref:4-(cytidine 5'-diphospho)-2-C-methyl-D-erythritol kinase n=1 Tax=Nitrosomonas nitrosa TaxID=52442 RepID=UPI000D3010C6|nr:4-(cytidine 5'-diphospho)-2-C-methyl-D-erythritol kinase [Nitrosomonas nitrosa]PTR02243.1 4-diphosphocytidyl-2-C-methyl-D-erythritol kinase [Nitrosomonas nitrosa]
MQTYPAPAKLNLFLHVTGQREDGYHLLQTVFRFLDFSDRLSFVLREDAVVKLHTPIADVPVEKNLCIRAARLLQQKSNTPMGVEISLEKHIPMGGGLGGGSSDAATTLLVLNRLWHLNYSKKELIELGLQLGADVPVFIFGENAFAEGIGEQLTSIDLPPAWYLVLIPSVHVSTAEIFSSRELTRNTIPITIPPFSIWQGRNDLESVVCRMYPVVARYLAWLKQQKDASLVAMSGSGGCVFAEFANEQTARNAFQQLPDGMRGFVAAGLAYHPLRNFLEE